MSFQGTTESYILIKHLKDRNIIFLDEYLKKITKARIDIMIWEKSTSETDNSVSDLYRKNHCLS